MARKGILCVVLLSLIFLLASLPAYSGIIYVWSGGNNTTGLSWTDAFTNLQIGINAAASQPEKTVWVHSGTYTQAVNVPNGVQVYGGFLETDSPLDPDPYGSRDFAANASIIHPGASSAFTVGTITRIDGFTVENGTGDAGGAVQAATGTCVVANLTARSNTSRIGGGIYASGTNLTVSNSRFVDLTATSALTNPLGGAICQFNGTLIVNNCEFTNDKAVVTGTTGNTAAGGAIFIYGAVNVSINRATFNGCMAYGTGVPTYFAHGGALDITQAKTSITNCVMFDCAALGAGDPNQSAGGAIAFHNQGSISIINNTFVNNSVMPQAGSPLDADRAYGLGGTIYLQGTSTAKLCNNIIAKSRGTAVVNAGMKVTFNYNLLWHNAGGDIYGFNWPTNSPMQGLIDANIMKNPQFRDEVNNDYHILYGSPARDAGINSGAPPTDIDGEARPNYSGPQPKPLKIYVDIGADEFVDTRECPTYGKADNDPRSYSLNNDDTDGDLIDDNVDNCVSTTNPSQRDCNGDGIGDVCTTIPEIYYVAPAPLGSPTNDGLSWATPLDSIQRAIDLADYHNLDLSEATPVPLQPWWKKNPMVWVATGTYDENIMIWHGVQVYGGFYGTLAIDPPLSVDYTTLSHRDTLANLTTIDGGSLTGNQMSTVIIAHLPQDRYLSTKLLTGSYKRESLKSIYDNKAPTVLDGFKVTHGKAEIGGGVSIYKENSLVTVNQIVGNTAALGGGLYAYNWFGLVGDGIGPPAGNILNNATVIQGNIALDALLYEGYGGGAYIERGAPIVFAELIKGNQAANGGGVAVIRGAPDIKQTQIGCEALPNVADGGTTNVGKGAGVYLDESPALFNRDTIVANVAVNGQGGGVWAGRTNPLAKKGSNYSMRNTVVAYNYAVQGKELWVNSSTPMITYSIFYDGTPATAFFGVNPLTNSTNRFISPVFVIDPITCVFMPGLNSPLFHSGDPEYPGEPKPNIGAYQATGPIATNILGAIGLPNGRLVSLTNVTVIAVTVDGVVVNDVSDPVGIKVIAYNSGLSVNQVVDVVGTMTQLTGGDREIINAVITP